MNANHVRPMLAFLLLAVVATVITCVGFRASTTGAEVRRTAPASGTRHTSQDPVPDGLLPPRPTSAPPAAGTSLRLWSSATAVEYAARRQQAVGARGAPGSAPADGPTASPSSATARAGSTSAGTGSGASSAPTVTATATATTTSPDPDPGPGRGQGPGPGGPGSANPPTDPGRGKGR